MTVNPFKLEPAYQPSYNAWKAQRTPKTTGDLLRAISPEIDRGMSAYSGANDNPLLRSRAKQLALAAIDTYDPAQAKLGTHIINHMQGLRRADRQERQVIGIPERLSLDSAYLRRVETELSDKLGRPPTLSELSDHAKLSRRRISHIRQIPTPVPEGRFLSALTEDSSTTLPAVEQEQRDTVIEAIYAELPPINQLIIDHTFGMHGQPKLSNQALAMKLRLTPGAISQRKLLIQRKLDDLNAQGLF